MSRETVDAYGTPVVAGDWVIAVGDPTRVAMVDLVEGVHVTVHHYGGGEPWTLRSRQLQVVTLRDAAGVRIDPGVLVRGIRDKDRVTGRVVAVLYRVHMITVDVGGPVTALTVPSLVTVVAADATRPAGMPEPGVRVSDDGSFSVPALDRLDRDVDVILAGGVPCPVVPEPRAAG